MIFTKSAIYLEVYEGKIKATELHSDRSIESACSGLKHQRSLMGDFFSVEKCFKETFSKLSPKKFLSTPPILYLHLFGKNEGGYTNVEIRAFTEAAIGAGARTVKLIDSKSLINKELLLKGQFSELKGI